jgi:integrase/recombinase XerD
MTYDPFPNGSALTVQQLIDCYLAHEPPRNADAAAEKRRVLALFAADFGARLVTGLRPYDLLFWIDAHPKWSSGWTKNRVKSTVAAPFAWMTKLGAIDRNPFARLSYPTGDTGRDMTEAEFHLLLRASGAPFRRILVFLRYSGARPVELRRLEWTQITEQAITQKVHKTARKTGRPRRIILNAILIKLLEWIKRNQQPPSQYVFLNQRGDQWTKRAICQHLERVRARAWLPGDVKLYGCRHAFGTGAILNGVDMATVGALLGHASIRTTQIYVHLANKDDHLAAAAAQAVRRRDH